MLRRPRRKLAISLTPLVDVIFLLLLFFMLSSTFSKFAEVELGTASASAATSSAPPIFLQLFPDRLTVNGQPQTIETLALEPSEGQSLLIALQREVTAQHLTDLLVVLRAYPDLNVAVLGSR